MLKRCLRDGLRVILFMVLVPLLLSSCAFGTRRVTLGYEAAANTQTAAVINEEVAVAKFADKRTQRGKDISNIGEIRNGMYIKTASVKSTDPDLGGWVSYSLFKELESRGYKTKAVPAPGMGNTEIEISGDVLKVYSVMYITHVSSKIDVRFVVTRNGVVLINKVYRGKDNDMITMITAESYKKFYNKAMRRLLDEFIGEFEAVIRGVGTVAPQMPEEDFEPAENPK